MSRTVKADPPKWYRKESARNRRASNRSLRARTRQAMRKQDFDNLPRSRGTEGWLTH